MEEASSRACPLATLAGVVVPRAAKTSFARSMSGVLKVPSSILKSSFWEGFVVPPEAASLFGLLGFLAVSVGLFTVLGCAASFSGLLVLETSCLGSDGAGGLHWMTKRPHCCECCEGLAQLWCGTVSQYTARLGETRTQNSWFLGKRNEKSTETLAASKPFWSVSSKKCRLFS